MYIYGVEEVKKRNNIKILMLVVLITIILVIISTIAGRKLAEEKNTIGKKDEEIINQEKKENIQEELSKNEVEKEKNNGNIEKASIDKLNKEQIENIKNIYKSDEKRVFLTFDDGPSSTVTPIILDILKQENIKATFFVLGNMVKNNPNMIVREYEEGHYIANHGYSHIYRKIYENENKVLEEYEITNKHIQDALGKKDFNSNVFRFPGGSFGGYYSEVKTNAKKLLEEKGIASLDWNALTNDSAGANTEELIMKNLKETCGGKNSVVVLMHDAPNKKLTAETLPKVISYLREQGFEFKNLYDIL